MDFLLSIPRKLGVGRGAQCVIDKTAFVKVTVRIRSLCPPPVMFFLRTAYNMRVRLRFTLIFAARISHHSIDNNVKMFTQT